MKFKTLLLLVLITLVGCAAVSETENEKNKGTKLAENEAKPNKFWWPNRVNLTPLRQHSSESNPFGKKFNYAKEFKKVSLKALKKDIEKVMKTSQDWWPADYGHYGPFFIRMAWHSSGTYRVVDGRGGAGGGQQRFEPLNSWPDNVNLDKARRLLWPVKKKYGRRVSWADLMVLAGNVALESMGFNTFGFAGGRTDDWEPDLVYWGPEKKFLASKRHHGKRKLKRPLGATRMGLIYVNPEGPNGVPNILKAADDIRATFGRMAMDDEETVALIAGGHSFGKAHGAARPEGCVGVEPGGAPVEQQDMGWKNKCGKGKGADTISSGLEGAWTSTPTTWSIQYLEFLFAFKWVQTKSPAGATQWIPEDKAAANLVPDAHHKTKRHAPIMFTTDLALKFDPSYKKISQRFLDNPKEFEKAFARAWFKLTHRDMGPRARYIGKDVPREVLAWQDPVPVRRHKLVSTSDIKDLKEEILKSGLSIPELVRTAWASAGSFRGTDMRGGANGARIRLAPQKDWAVNNPKELKRVLSKLTEVQKEFNDSLSEGKKISLADVIVLGGAAAIEKASKKAGIRIKVGFRPGRTDASQKQTDVKSFSFLEPKADGFRNFYTEAHFMSPITSLIDRANMLGLTVPEMTALVGGLRVLGANSNNSKHGVFTKRAGILSNDFFVNLLDMSTKWTRSSSVLGTYEGRSRKSGQLVWTATPVDLVFGSSSELRSISEVYASNDGRVKFARDFSKAWSKVMGLDRFDLR